MSHKWLWVLLAVTLSGCSLVGLEKTYYKSDLGAPPKEKQLSFQSKEALAAGATLSNQKAAQIFYEGTKPKSKEAKIVYDLSYRFMGLAGVNVQYNPDDPESIAKVFAAADKALEENNARIHDLEKQVKQVT